MLAKKIIKFERTKLHCNIGTIGHVDHGKTTLTAAITRCLQNIGNTVFKGYSDIDNCTEERERGITINAAHIEYETEKRHYSHIDCPGHQQYVKNMLTGASQMEGAILVVAVNDGPQVQTREHIILAKEVGIPYIIVYINKLDMNKISGDMKELVELEVRELLESYGFPQDLPVLGGSARLALEETEYSELGMGSVQLLMNTVDTYIKQPERNLNADFLLSIEGSLVARGRGTVVTGKVEQGVINVNDELEVLSSIVRPTTCLGLEMFRKSLDRAEVGDNVGILIRGIKKDEVSRGNILAKPGSVKIYNSFKCKVYILTKKEGGRSKGFTTNYKPQFFFRTMNVTGAVVLPENTSFVLPGDNLTLTVNLVNKVPLNLGLRLVMREGNLTIGAGVITEFLN
jgi:elongation factor Tu